MNQWSLRDEILAVTHRWPIIVLFILVGCLVGWGTARIWPSPYQATAELYVGIDVYRWAQDPNIIRFTGGVVFNYPDDYKNWQMANLNVIILTDDVKKEILRRLREHDSYWLDVNKEQLGNMMEVYWRNAGKWRIVVNNLQAQHATQAVAIWQDVALELIQTAIFHARESMLSDIQLQSIAAQQTQTKEILAAEQDKLQQFDLWQTQLSKLPADQPVTVAQRSQLLALAAANAKESPGWNALLSGLPSAGDRVTAFLNWVAAAQALLQEEIQLSQQALDRLQNDWEQTNQAFIQASQSSRGVSPTLQVEKISDTIAPPLLIRPTSTLALIGGVLGLVVWALFWSGWLALKARR